MAVIRNLQEQVYKNMQDIANLVATGVLSEFGIKVVGQEATEEDLPTVEEYKTAHEDWEYGDAYAIGITDPYELFILTRANGTHPNDYWFYIGSFPEPGPQGETGATGPQGPQGPAGENGSDGKGVVNFTMVKTSETESTYTYTWTCTYTTGNPDTGTFTIPIGGGGGGTPTEYIKKAYFAGNAIVITKVVNGVESSVSKQFQEPLIPDNTINYNVATAGIGVNIDGDISQDYGFVKWNPELPAFELENDGILMPTPLGADLGKFVKYASSGPGWYDLPQTSSSTYGTILSDRKQLKVVNSLPTTPDTNAIYFVIDPR